MTIRSMAFAIALCTVGCGGEDTAPAPGHERGPFGAASSAPVAPPPVPAPLGPTGRRSREPDMFDHGTIAPSTGTVGATTTDHVEITGGTIVAPAERRFGVELATAIGSPAGCIDVATARALHGRLVIQVSATVMPTGGDIPESCLNRSRSASRASSTVISA